MLKAAHPHRRRTTAASAAPHMPNTSHTAAEHRSSLFERPPDETCHPRKGGPESEESMRKIRSSWSAAALALALAGPAHATTLVTQGLRVGAEDLVTCQIVNAGTREIGGQIELLDELGGSEATTFSVVPGAEANVAFIGTPGSFHCRFTGAFSKRDVRASIHLILPQAAFSETAATAPAQ